MGAFFSPLSSVSPTAFCSIFGWFSLDEWKNCYQSVDSAAYRNITPSNLNFWFSQSNHLLCGEFDFGFHMRIGLHSNRRVVICAVRHGFGQPANRCGASCSRSIVMHCHHDSILSGRHAWSLVETG